MKKFFSYHDVLNEFCKEINLEFKDITLLEIAFTHSSYANENYLSKNNERLEFLGDSVLENVVRSYLYSSDETATAGAMTKLKGTIVDRNANNNYGKLLNIDKYIRIGNGVDTDHQNIIGNAFEALIGAIYLDQGYYCAYDFIVNKILSTVNFDESNSTIEYSWKNELQERYVQRDIEYRLVKEEGYDHNKTFYIDVYIDGIKAGSGIGNRKKDAEQEAAKEALEKEIPVTNQQSFIGGQIAKLFEQGNTLNRSMFDKANDMDNSKERLYLMVPNREISYHLIHQEGKDHQKMFYIDVYASNEKMGSGSGTRKIIAERNAAKDAINKILKQRRFEEVNN